MLGKILRLFPGAESALRTFYSRGGTGSHAESSPGVPVKHIPAAMMLTATVFAGRYIGGYHLAVTDDGNWMLLISTTSV